MSEKRAPSLHLLYGIITILFGLYVVTPALSLANIVFCFFFAIFLFFSLMTVSDTAASVSVHDRSAETIAAFVFGFVVMWASWAMANLLGLHLEQHSRMTCEIAFGLVLLAIKMAYWLNAPAPSIEVMEATPVPASQVI